MLQIKTIDPSILGLLNSLMALSSLKDTRLVGGTALALLLGHRHSVDIDLFGIIVGDESELEDQINSLGKIVAVRKTANKHTWMINGI